MEWLFAVPFALPFLAFPAIKLYGFVEDKLKKSTAVQMSHFFMLVQQGDLILNKESDTTYYAAKGTSIRAVSHDWGSCGLYFYFKSRDRCLFNFILEEGVIKFFELDDANLTEEELVEMRPLLYQFLKSLDKTVNKEYVKIERIRRLMEKPPVTPSSLGVDVPADIGTEIQQLVHHMETEIKETIGFRSHLKVEEVYRLEQWLDVEINALLRSYSELDASNQQIKEPELIRLLTLILSQVKDIQEAVHRRTILSFDKQSELVKERVR